MNQNLTNAKITSLIFTNGFLSFPYCQIRSPTPVPCGLGPTAMWNSKLRRNLNFRLPINVYSCKSASPYGFVSFSFKYSMMRRTCWHKFLDNFQNVDFHLVEFDFLTEMFFILAANYPRYIYKLMFLNTTAPTFAVWKEVDPFTIP